MPVPAGYTPLAQALAEVTLDVFQQVQARLNLDAQAFSDVLTSISFHGLDTGYLVINGDSTVSVRTLTASGGLQVLNGNGVTAVTEYSLNVPVARTALSIDNTNNTADANKPVSTAQAAAIALKADINNAVFTGTTTLAGDPGAALQAATKQYVDATVNALLDAANAEQYKGLLDCSANPNYPAANIGWTYRVSVAGLIGGGAGVAVEIGDRVQCIVDGSATGTQAAVGANWWITQANVAFTSNGVSLVTAANYAAMKTLLALDNVANTSDANKPVSTAQQTALNLKANLISPAFTTPDLGVATASRINKVNIVQPATAAALAIGDNQTLTVNASMVLATAVVNPTLTFQGTDTYMGRATADTMTNKQVATAAAGTNTADVTNTAFVQQELAALIPATVTKTANYTAVAGDKRGLIVGTGTWTLALTAAATLGNRWRMSFRNAGTGVITIDPNGAETIDGQTTTAIQPGEAFDIVCDAATFYTVGRADTQDYTNYTPTVASSTVGGTPATFTKNSARWRRDRKRMWVGLDYTVANQGVGNSGTVDIDVPAGFTVAAFRFVGSGVAYGAIMPGRGLTASITASGTKISIQGVGPETVIVTNCSFNAQIEFEVT